MKSRRNSRRKNRPAVEPFPFLRLPELVQSKILKQYVPVLSKIHALDQIPEFSDMLRDRSSWMNVSEEFTRLIPVLRSLREGLYVVSTDLPEHGYYVSRDNSEDKIAFTLCCIGEKIDDTCPMEMRRFEVSTSVSNLREFIEFFLEHYCPVEEKQVSAYRFHKCYDFFINPARNAVLWHDGFVYPILYGTCSIGSPWNVFSSFFLADIHVRLQNGNKTITVHDGCDEIHKLRSKSLKSLLLTDDRLHTESEKYLSSENWKGGDPLPLSRKAGRFEISLAGKEKISVNASTPEAVSCWRFNNKKLMDKLSPSINENVKLQLPSHMQWYYL